ncbi:hypothetical protein RUND412_004116 [Rhizina undulata]
MERSKILEWFSRVPFEEHHLFIRQFRQAGTGKWLLEKREFIDWKDSPSSSILWLHGIAGGGKTTLASLVIDESMSSSNHAIACFYCKHGERDRQDPVSILSTIIKQLSLMGPEGSLPQSVVSVFNDHKSKSGEMQLSESQKLIASLPENFVQTVIVIDALDECDKESRRQLLNALDIIIKSSAGVIKLFVTSRDADDIALKLEGTPNIYIHSSDNSGDIAAFVRAEVEKCTSEKLLLRGSVRPEIKESIIEKLTSGADGMFLWVTLQIKSICEEKSAKAIQKALKQLPKGLKGTYSVIWDKICGSSKENELLARRTLKWILCAKSPLAEAEIVDAVPIEPMDFTGSEDHEDLTVQDLLDVCQNLIVVDEQLGVLRTAHFSVNEYLQDHFKMAEAHGQAAEICLTLMRRPKIYDEPPMPRATMPQRMTPRPSIYHERHPLRYYMSDHWAYHIRFSDDASNNLLELQKAVFNGSPAFYAWLREAEKRYCFRLMEQEEKLTPLWVASFYKLWDICKSLLRSNPGDCNISNNLGQTPLFWAAYDGNEEVVKLLLEVEGVDVDFRNGSGRTPLSVAASGGHETVIKLLLEKEGVDPNSRNSVRRETPLWTAASKGHETIVKLFLEKEGVNLNSEDVYGRTPLDIALKSKHKAVVEVNLSTSVIEIEVTANIFASSTSYCIEFSKKRHAIE